ncbi:hypothetical protein ACQ4PT_040464 [Festuca glaucescens]
MLGGIIGDLTGGLKNAHLKGSVVLMRKNVLDFNDFGATVVDGIAEFLGRGVTCQLISSTVVDHNNGNRGKVGAEASLEQWLIPTSLPSITTGESKFGVTFDWSVDKLGVPGAIIIKNNHASEFFLKTITLDNVPGRGTVFFVANSWVYPQAKYRYNRVFFANDTYLPHQMPEALKPYRDDELRNLRGDDQQGPYETHARVYRYDVYNDLGEGRPILGGTDDHPYPRRGRTGRKLSQTGAPHIGRRKVHVKAVSSALSCGERSWLCPWSFRCFSMPGRCSHRGGVRDPAAAGGGTIYVPRDEVFGHLKMADFFRYTIKALIDGIVPAIRTYVDLSPGEFDSFQDVIKLYEGGIKLPNIPALEEMRKRFPLELVKDLVPIGGDYIPAKKKKRLHPQAPQATNGSSLQRVLLIPVSTATTPAPSPVAIELSSPLIQGSLTTAKSTVYTPESTGVEAWIWQLAKAYVAVNDYGWHQLISHWLNTHAVMEPFVIATNRQLSVTHPVNKLLVPHYRDTMNINSRAREALINTGGII